MNCIWGFESVARPDFRRTIDDFTRQKQNLAHLFIEETIELVEKRGVTVAHRLDPTFQTAKVADYEDISWGQPLCHEVTVMRHMLNQVNQRRCVNINYQG